MIFFTKTKSTFIWVFIFLHVPHLLSAGMSTVIDEYSILFIFSSIWRPICPFRRIYQSYISGFICKYAVILHILSCAHICSLHCDLCWYLYCAVIVFVDKWYFVNCHSHSTFTIETKHIIFVQTTGHVSECFKFFVRFYNRYITYTTCGILWQ